MPNLQDIGDTLESQLRDTRNNYFSVVLDEQGEKRLYGVKKNDGFLHVACGRGNSFISYMLRRVDGKWKLFSNPLMPSSQAGARVLGALVR